MTVKLQNQTTCPDNAGPGTTAFERSRFLPGLHGLRAVAALSVALFHQSPNLKIPSFAEAVKTYGGLGVQLFFVLSAFSLCHSTLPRVSQSDWIRTFAIKRIFRIAPMFYAGILFFSIYDWFVWHKVYTFSEYTINLLMVHNFVPGQHQSIVWAGWTIGVEMIFYAVFPLVISTIQGLLAASVFFILSCLASIAINELLASAQGIPGDYPYMSFLSALPSFSGGVLAFYGAQALSRRAVSPWKIQWGCGFAVLVLLELRVISQTHGGSSVQMLFWSASFSILCLWQALAPGMVMCSRAMRFIGERSYSIYLTHAVILFRLMPVYALVYAIPNMPVGLAYLICVTGGLVCVLLVASALYRFVEVPAIRLGSVLSAAGRR